MIPWQKYDPTDRSIKSHVTHLVVAEGKICLAQHARSLEGKGYEWSAQGGYKVSGVTHWALINLPGEE